MNAPPKYNSHFDKSLEMQTSNFPNRFSRLNRHIDDIDENIEEEDVDDYDDDDDDDEDDLEEGIDDDNVSNKCVSPF